MFVAWICWIILPSWLKINKKKEEEEEGKNPFKAAFVSRGVTLWISHSLTFSERQAFLWCGNTVCRIPTNIALWIIKTKLQCYPFKVSNLVKTFSLSDFSVFIIHTDNNPFGHVLCLTYLLQNECNQEEMSFKEFVSTTFSVHIQYMQLERLSALWLLH